MTISYGIAKTWFNIEEKYQVKTPWEWLTDWEMSDRDPNTTLDMITDRMKLRWPGNYRIVVREFRVGDSMYRSSKWVLKFDTPAEETVFRLKYS